jgi:hypothetical protein
MYILRNIAALRPCYEPDTGNPGGAGTGPSGGNAAGNPPADPAGGGAGDRQNVTGLLQRHNNDAMAVIATLLSENHNLRDERRTLRGQLPAQGTVVLSGEQATAWQAYQQLGAVEALSAQLQGAQTAQAELASLRRESLLGRVQEVSGYKASVLGKLPGADKLDFQIREVEKDGKKEPTVVVKDGDKETPLADYAKTNWSDFLPALQVTQTQQPTGTTFVRQDAGGTAPANTLDAYAKRFQEQRDAAANPLAAPAAARSPLA